MKTKFSIPRPNKLDRYLIKKFIGTYLGTILATILIVIIFDLSEKIDKFVDIPLQEIVFDYYCSFIPWILNSFGPLFIFIAVIFFTSQLASHSELIAILSSGVSYRRLMLPYMSCALLIGLFYFFMGMYVIPPANMKRSVFEDKYIGKQKTASGNKDIHYQIAQGQFVYVEQFSPWANTAYKFSLETIEDGQIKSKLSAESAAWDSLACCWKLKNYTLRNFYGASETVTSGRSIDTVINLTVDDFYRRQNIVQSLAAPELDRLIEIQRMRGDEEIKRSLIEKNDRIATPFSAFILTIMAVALSSRKKRGGIGINIAIGLGLSFTYVLFQRFSQMFVFSRILSPALALWLPNMLYATIAAILYKFAPK